MSEAEWEAAYEQEYQQAFAAAYSTASGAIERKSVSNVDVAGLGVIADVNAAATSKFTSTAQLIDGATRDGNGNGNASAGANLATSSYANQNNSTTANAFMQAFSGGLPEANGTQTVKSITRYNSNGFSIVTDRVSTVRNTTAYTVDGNDGNATNGAEQATDSSSTETHLSLATQILFSLPFTGGFFWLQTLNKSAITIKARPKKGSEEPKSACKPIAAQGDFKKQLSSPH